MKRLNYWFEINEHEYLMYLLKGYELVVEEERVMWTFDGKLHKEDGPAVIYSDGYQAWYMDNRCHREDGPAVIWQNGDEMWYLHGTQQQYIRSSDK